jgi:hypothetical protein
MKMVTFDYKYLDEDEREVTRELTLKSSRMMPNKTAHEIAQRPTEVTRSVLAWGMSDEDYQWWLTIPAEANDFGQTLVTAWQKASGVEVGESSASSTS